MEFISTKGMTNETAPEGMVLVQYLEPSFGRFAVDFALAYYDNPNDYNNSRQGRGWVHWHTENPINVLAYAVLPEKMKSTQITQVEFRKLHGSFHPNMGCVGE